MKLLSLCLLLTSLVIPAIANQRSYGFCQNGNTPVVTGGVSSTTRVQGSYPGCTVTVYEADGVTLATIYSDNLPSPTPKANPFVADGTTGFWFFYAANGTYRTQISGGGLVAPLIIGDVLLFDPGAVTLNTPYLVSSTYDFTPQSPGGTISGGTNTFTLAPVPPGVNGTNSRYYLYIYGTGTPEACLVTGGTAVSGGGSGTIQATCANSHSAGWSVKSATAGMSEAAYAAGCPGALIRLPYGNVNVYGPVGIPSACTIWIQGAGRSATVVNVATTFCNPVGTPGICSQTVNGVFDFSPGQVTALAADSGGVTDLTISFTQPNSLTLTDYTHWPPAMYASGNNHVTLANAIVQRAWDVFNSPLSNGISAIKVGFSHFHRGIIIDQSFDVNFITDCESWVFGLDTNQSLLYRNAATNNYSLDLKGADLVYLSKFASIAGKFATLSKNGGGVVTQLLASDIDIDTNGGFEMSNGYVSMTNVGVSTLVGTAAFSVSGGTLRMVNVNYLNAGTTTAFITYAPNQNNSGYAAGHRPGVYIDGLSVSANAEDQFIVYAEGMTGFTANARVLISNAFINRVAAVAYTKPLFTENGGTGTITFHISESEVNSNGGTSAQFANFVTSLNHSITFSDAPSGWTLTVPTTTRQWMNTGDIAFNRVPTGGLNVVGLPVYANNAAAITGGLIVGSFYRTGANPDPVMVVH